MHSRAANSVCSLRPCGGGVGRGVAKWAAVSPHRTTPTPNPSPQGQGNRIWVNKYESLTERTESKSSEIPVLFTHMRLPCPQGGGEHTVFAARSSNSGPVAGMGGGGGTCAPGAQA